LKMMSGISSKVLTPTTYKSPRKASTEDRDVTLRPSTFRVDTINKTLGRLRFLFIGIGHTATVGYIHVVNLNDPLGKRLFSQRPRDATRCEFNCVPYHNPMVSILCFDGVHDTVLPLSTGASVAASSYGCLPTIGPVSGKPIGSERRIQQRAPHNTLGVLVSLHSLPYAYLGRGLSTVQPRVSEPLPVISQACTEHMPAVPPYHRPCLGISTIG
jgi:hypothetical protein